MAIFINIHTSSEQYVLLSLYLANLILSTILLQVLMYTLYLYCNHIHLIDLIEARQNTFNDQMLRPSTAVHFPHICVSCRHTAYWLGWPAILQGYMQCALNMCKILHMQEVIKKLRYIWSFISKNTHQILSCTNIQTLVTWLKH